MALASRLIVGTNHSHSSHGSAAPVAVGLAGHARVVEIFAAGVVAQPGGCCGHGGVEPAGGPFGAQQGPSRSACHGGCGWSSRMQRGWWPSMVSTWDTDLGSLRGLRVLRRPGLLCRWLVRVPICVHAIRCAIMVLAAGLRRATDPPAL